MRSTTAWSLLLTAGFLAAAGSAFGQVHVVAAADIDPFLASERFAVACSDGLSRLADEETHTSDTRSRSQRVDVDDDDILLAIALANNGAHDITWNKVRDFSMTQSRTFVGIHRTDLEREDVFSALALGVRATAGSLEALACVSDVARTVTETMSMSRTVNLEEDDVLLAIALANSVGGTLNFDDIADLDESVRHTFDELQEVDVERQDAFLALALGGGGSAGGILT